jgi:hypothetical protein
VTTSPHPAPRPRERRQRPLSPQQLHVLALLAQPGAYGRSVSYGTYLITNHGSPLVKFNTLVSLIRRGLAKWKYPDGTDLDARCVITRAGREALRASAAAAGAGGEGAR